MHTIEARAFPLRYALRGFVRALKTGFAVERLSGTTERHGLPASIIVAGTRPGGGYPANQVLAGSPERLLLSSERLWTLPRTLAELTPSADLVLARVDALSARMLFGSDYLHVPSWVTMRLEMPRHLRSLTAGKRAKSLRADLARVRRNRITCELSHSTADLEAFYHGFYVPYARQNFGQGARPVGLPVFRRRFEHGGLFWALQDGQRIAGGNFARGRAMLRLEALGTRDGDRCFVEMGAFTALCWAQIEHAHALGCREVSFNASPGVLTDGTLRYKRKFGARIVDLGYSARRLLRWAKLNPTLLALLATTPVVFREQGHPSAVRVLDVATPASQDEVGQAYRFLRTPGVHRIHLLSAAGFADHVTAPPQTCLLDLRTVGEDNLATLLTSGALSETCA
jgi:hypothetical protein